MSSDNYDKEKLLIDALISRKESAYRYVIEKYREPVIRLCRGFTGSFEDAEDLAQDIFIEVFRSVDRFKAQSSLSTWIYRIAVNKSLNFLRDRKKRYHDSSYSHDEAQIRSDEDTSADGSLVQKDHARALHGALDKLPEAQRTAFILSKYEEMKYSEIAGIMKTSISSVESLLFRAKRNLQENLKDYYMKNIG